MNNTKTILPRDVSIQELQHLLQGAIGPRPIAFASTIDAQGRDNLAPFSFFNVFSANPPILVFSPALSGRDGSSKNTLENVKIVPETVINVVNYDMVYSMSLASSPYPAGISEFTKAGFTSLKSEFVKPKRVKESPVQIECKVIEIKPLGTAGGAGNLVICEVLAMHVNQSILNDKGQIDQQKIDLVARMGGNYYARAHGQALFEIPKPITTLGIGVDNLPHAFKHYFTANEMGQMGSLETMPEPIESNMTLEECVPEAKKLLANNMVDKALALILGAN